MQCRFCGNTNLHEVVNLGHQPPSNSFLTREKLDLPEVTYPLRLYVCPSCWLVQLPEIAKAADIFTENYPYYSSQSPANVSHAKEYVEMMLSRFFPNSNSKPVVLEIGSNDGYMLKQFKKNDCLVQGIDPAEGPARLARLNGIPTIVDFFSKDMATHPAIEGEYNLICSINTIAHQPDINDCVEGMKIALAPNGVITAEFPHLMKMIDGCQFDTIYAEHFSYFSLVTICAIFEKHLLSVFDVDEIPEHGGSLRIYAEHSPSCRYTDRLRELLLREAVRGMFDLNYYADFQSKVSRIKRDLVNFLINIPDDQIVAGYGAPAKANTLLNCCSIGSDLLPFVVDKSPHKVGKYLPGSHIPVYDVNELWQYQPDYVLIMPWNLKKEIMEQLKDIRQWGGKFVIAIPNLETI